jgi:hypothetical protein
LTLPDPPNSRAPQFIQITPPAIAGIGLGGWVTVLVAIIFTAALVSALLTWRELHRAKQLQLPVAQQPGAAVATGAPGSSGGETDAAAVVDSDGPDVLAESGADKKPTAV